MLPMWRFRPRGWDEMSWYKLATYDTALPRTQVMEIKRNFCRLSSCSQEDRLWTWDSRTAFSHPCKTVTVFISRKSYLLSNLDFHTRMMNQINTRPDHTGCHLPQQDHVLCLFVFRNYFFKKKKICWTELNIIFGEHKLGCYTMFLVTYTKNSSPSIKLSHLSSLDV